ncbi:RING-type E3 ubiquitin transferase [Sarracenia purpurea var. burkii]
MASIAVSLFNFFSCRPKSHNHKINSFDHDFPQINPKGLSVWPHKHKLSEPIQVAECVICLCEVKEGDEVRELRCDHLFHMVCLGRWVEFKNNTCPLCRGSFAPAKWATEIGDKQVLYVNFPNCFSLSRRNSWWLR